MERQSQWGGSQEDDMGSSWVGPAVVVAVERFDGAIKRVWIRYRHKLRGLPLEHVRLATGDEIESTKVTKEALHKT